MTNIDRPAVPGDFVGGCGIDMKFANAAMFIVVTFFLAGCQTSRDEYGASPLHISSGLQDAFDEYLNAGSPMYFWVSEDGRAYGYSGCQTGRCSRGSDLELSRDGCSRMAAGVPCKLYAVGRAIVWERSALTLSSTGSPRTVNVPEGGMRDPTRRWNAGRIEG